MDHDLIDSLSLFRGLTPEQLVEMEKIFLPCDYYAGTTLFEQGSPAEYLFVVVVGEVVVNFKPDDGPVIVVSHIQPGGVVGWSAALGSRLYTSGASCTTYTQLLRVRGSDLRQLCLQHSDTGVLVLERLATVIAERLNSTHALVMSLLKMGLTPIENLEI
ncbi:MAG TPA: cyclic nucleotide-binding domain-containing protein [Anaerolineales bacterium]|nr:cyclic nucleotide-binding domain-containing protein [Anaerolineales bacterium]